jgi:low affinity Fe/Cu permease
MSKSLKQFLTNAGTWLSRPMGRCSGWHLYGVLADFFDRASFSWYAITSIATLLMTLFIQRSEHRDTQVIQAKPITSSKAGGLIGNRQRRF